MRPDDVRTSRRGPLMANQPAPPSLLIDPTGVTPFDRGNGAVTVPYVGAWNCTANGAE